MKKALAERTEALRATRALTTGIACSLTCAALLVAAVAITWYGPDKDKPKIEVTSPTVYGEVVRISRGLLTLKTVSGELVIDLRTATGLRAVAACQATMP